MLIREYISSDCEGLAELFFQTVHTVNSKDYTKEQLNVWATGNVELSVWNNSFLEHYTLVALETYFTNKYSPAYVVSTTQPVNQEATDFWFEVTG